MSDDAIRRIREFNRYYTAWLEVMNKEYLGTGLSWAESRVLFEVHLCPGISATTLCGHLRMDKSHVSRIVGKFEKAGLLTREPVPGRKGLKKILLTEMGEEAASQIDRKGSQQIVDKLGMLDDDTCAKLCEAMGLIQKVLSENGGDAQE